MVMGYTVLGFLPSILTLSLFVAIVATLSRMYRDSEMVIWFSAGRGLSAFVRPLLGFAWPVLLTMVIADSCVAITDKPTAHHGRLLLARK